MRWPRFSFVAFFLVLLAAINFPACGSNDKCSNDTDCLAGQFCRLDPATNAKTCQGGTADTCNPACATGQTCVARKCVTVCDPPCKSNEACQQGKCVSVGTGCDPACNAGQSCVNGKCVDSGTEASGNEPSVGPEPGQEPSSGEERPPQDNKVGCTTDNDCNAGFFCSNGKCAPKQGPEPNPTDNGPGPEPSPGDASAGPETPPQDQQLPPDTPPADQSGSGCSNCADNQQCVNNACVTENNGNIGNDCSPQATCPSGLSCLDIGPGISKCLQKCKNNGDCQNNSLRKVCMQLTANDSYCVNIATTGQKCGLDKKVQAICDANSVCQDGQCKKPVVSKPQESCGTGGRVCPQNFLCIRFPSNDGKNYSFCMEQCTKPGDKTACKNNFTCEQLGPNFGFCLPPGNANADDLCGGNQTGTKFDASRTCKSGLSCVGLIQPVCLAFANGTCAASKLTCPPNRKCNEIRGPQGQTFSICNLVCSKDSDCGKSHMFCDTNQKTCWPKTPTGTVEYGQACKPFGTTNQLCKQGLSCFNVTGGASGVCSKGCSKAADCPSAKDDKGNTVNAVCMINTNMCAFPCSGGAACPKGLKCIQQQYCGP